MTEKKRVGVGREREGRREKERRQRERERRGAVSGDKKSDKVGVPLAEVVHGCGFVVVGVGHQPGGHLCTRPLSTLCLRVTVKLEWGLMGRSLQRERVKDCCWMLQMASWSLLTLLWRLLQIQHLLVWHTYMQWSHLWPRWYNHMLQLVSHTSSHAHSPWLIPNTSTLTQTQLMWYWRRVHNIFTPWPHADRNMPVFCWQEDRHYIHRTGSLTQPWLTECIYVHCVKWSTTCHHQRHDSADTVYIKCTWNWQVNNLPPPKGKTWRKCWQCAYVHGAVPPKSSSDHFPAPQMPAHKNRQQSLLAS